MFDLQWSSSTGEGDNSASFYRTLITREDVVWQYINQDQKPVDDYPVHVKEEYIGLTANPDAVFQLYDYKTGFFGDVYVLFGKWVNLTISAQTQITRFSTQLWFHPV